MTELPFKAVAVDMDGTFENDNRHYDKEKFKKILDQLRAHGAHFIAASGRPAARLAKDFAGFTDRVDLVADNGGALIRDEKVVKTNCFTRDSVLKMIHVIQDKFPEALPYTLVSAIKHTYCLESLPQDREEMMSFYYPNTVRIKDFENIPDDQYTKITLSYKYTIGQKIADEFNKISSQKVHFSSSGFENIDLVLEGVNKAIGLKELLNYLDVSPTETIAFGDNENDVEMLKMVGYSYAMANGTDQAKAAAKYEAPSNNDEGVFKVLEEYLNNAE